jgi:RNA 2',3'-cyclic 3'-phosphodiesterase
MRVFFGIDVGDGVRTSVDELARVLRPRVPRARFVPRENLHLTLRFLGESSDETVRSVTAAVSRETAALGAFQVAFRGLGVFPDARRARVLWVGTANPPEELFRLHSHVEAVARNGGFEPERGAFHPHLTLARFREPPQGIDRILSEGEGRDFGSTMVRTLVLFESKTLPEGARYRALRSFPLGSTPEARSRGGGAPRH